jgi:hypothetical protein
MLKYKQALKKMFDVCVEGFLVKTDQFDSIKKFWEPQQFDGNYSHTEFWDSTDTKEKFLSNSQQKYSKTSIEYHFNGYGYRIPDKTSNSKSQNQNTIACFGCSQTFGVGVKYEETWPFYLEKRLSNKQFITKNYGISGASADQISRIIHNYLLTNKPKIICCLLPDMFRRELFDNSGSSSPRNFNNLWSEDIKLPLMVKCKIYDYNIVDWRAYKRLSGEDNSLFNFIKNLKFIEALCKANNVDLYTMTWDPYVLSLTKEKKFSSDSFVGDFTDTKFEYLLNWGEMEKARDGIHLGAPSNNLYAELFARRINEDHFRN